MYGQWPPPRKRMGVGRVLLVLAVLGFSGWYVYTTLMPSGIRTAVIQSGNLGSSFHGDALIVRNETAYDEEGVTSIQYLAEEGSKVYNGDLICLVYSSGYSQKEVNTLQGYRDQIKLYLDGLISQESTFDQRMTRLEGEVLQGVREVRRLVHGAKGNLLNLEKVLDTAIDARQDYLREKYRADTRLSRLFDDEATQEKRIQSYTRQRSATQESLVSFYTDGYEQLNTGNFEEFSPAQVRAMLNGQKPEKTVVQRGRTTIYRLVRESSWGVLLLLDEPVWTPVQGKTYELKLEQFDNTVVSATVLSFTRSGGELLVRLSISSDVAPVLFMRTCQAQLGEYVSSMMVPTRCIYTQPDPNTGASVTGVVVVDGVSQWLVPVNIVSTDGDKTYIEAVQQGLLYEGQTVRVF